MSGWLEAAARRVAGVEAASSAVAEIEEPGARLARDVLLRRAGVAAATLLVMGTAPAARARSLSCGSEPGVRGSYKTYAGCVRNGAGRHFRERLLSCRREEAQFVDLAKRHYRKWMDFPNNPWLTEEAVQARELRCTQEAFGDWARAADECARRCPIPRSKRPKRPGPLQPVPTAPRPPGVPAGIPPSSYDACLNCMGVGGQCCPKSKEPYFCCTHAQRECSPNPDGC